MVISVRFGLVGFAFFFFVICLDLPFTFSTLLHTLPTTHLPSHTHTHFMAYTHPSPTATLLPSCPWPCGLPTHLYFFCPTHTHAFFAPPHTPFHSGLFGQPPCSLVSCIAFCTLVPLHFLLSSLSYPLHLIERPFLIVIVDCAVFGLEAKWMICCCYLIG